MFVSAVQLNLKHCFSKKQFIDYIEKQVFNKLLVIPEIICFPENINYCLLFAKKETISSLSIKSSFENVFDKIISKLDLSFIFRFLNIKNQENIILVSIITGSCCVCSFNAFSNPTRSLLDEVPSISPLLSMMERLL
jgi:hypothetical protein